MLPPKPLTNCKVINITHSAFTVSKTTLGTHKSYTILQVHCKPDNFMSSSLFSIVVSVTATDEETFSSQSLRPHFIVNNLLSSTFYTVKLWSSNSHGDSDPNYISVTTLNVPDIAERKLKKSEEESSVVWLSAFISLTVIIIVFILTVMILKYHRRSITRYNSDTNAYHEEIDKSEWEEVGKDWKQENKTILDEANVKLSQSKFKFESSTHQLGMFKSETERLVVIESDKMPNKRTANISIRESVI